VRTPRTSVSCNTGSRIGKHEAGRIGGSWKDDGVGKAKGELYAGDDMTDDDDSDTNSTVEIAEMKTGEKLRPRGCMQHVCGHIKAFTSFAAIVLFWYSIYDSVGTFPVQVLKHYLVTQQALDFDTNPGFLRARLVEFCIGAALVAFSLSSLMAGKGFMYTTDAEDDQEDIEFAFESSSSDDAASLRTGSHDSTHSEGASLQALGRKYVKPMGARIIKGRLAPTRQYVRVAEKDIVAKVSHEHDHDSKEKDQVVVHECAARVDLDFAARHVAPAAKADGPALALGCQLHGGGGMSPTGVKALQQNHEALCDSAECHADTPLSHATSCDAVGGTLASISHNPLSLFDQHSHAHYNSSAPAVPRNITMNIPNLAGETASQPQDTRPTWFSGMMWELRHVTMCGHKLHIDRYVYIYTHT
jgi:hypothetical protein